MKKTSTDHWKIVTLVAKPPINLWKINVIHCLPIQSSLISYILLSDNWALHLFNEDRGGWDEEPSKEGNMYLTIASKHSLSHEDPEDAATANMAGQIRFQQVSANSQIYQNSWYYF